MAKSIKKCPVDGSYSLQDKCPACGKKTVTCKPPKYSPEDKYGKYRRIAKDILKKTSSRKTISDLNEAAKQAQAVSKRLDNN